MYNPMAPCPECDRHIRISESDCPFCGYALSGRLAAAPDTTRRMSRAAAFVFGATVAVSACGDTVTVDDDSSSNSSSSASSSSSGGGGGQTLYGGPAVGSGGSAGIGGNQAMYGAPAVGGGGGSSGDGGFSADYGAPPLPPND
jgi:hypothetical protein